MTGLPPGPGGIQRAGLRATSMRLSRALGSTLVTAM